MMTAYRASRAASLKCSAVARRAVVGRARGDQAEGARAPGDERARRLRRHVPQLRDRLLDAVARRRSHVRQVVEHARHRLVRDAGEPCDVEDRRDARLVVWSLTGCCRLLPRAPRALTLRHYPCPQPAGPGRHVHQRRRREHLLQDDEDEQQRADEDLRPPRRLSVPSNVMIVWMTPSTSTPSTEPSTKP